MKFLSKFKKKVKLIHFSNLTLPSPPLLVILSTIKVKPYKTKNLDVQKRAECFKNFFSPDNMSNIFGINTLDLQTTELIEISRYW